MSDPVLLSDPAAGFEWAPILEWDPDWTRVVVAGQRQALGLATCGAPLRDVLAVLAHTAEAQAGPDALASIMLVAPDGFRLRRGATASVLAVYAESVERREIGPTGGCCSSAAYTRLPVVISDIATDRRCAEFRELLLGLGVRGCWATPILSSDREVLGAFALYHRQPRSPTVPDGATLQLLTDTAAVVIERDRASRERAAAWRAVEATERRYRDLIDAVPAAIYGTDEAGRVTHYNRGAATLWGRAPVVGRDIWPGSFTMLSPDGAPLSLSEGTLTAAFPDRAGTTGVEAIVERPSGERRNVLVYPRVTRAADGGLLGGVNIMLDITDRKRIEEALARSEAFATGVVANTPDCVMMLDLNARLLWMSDHGLTLMDIADFELIRGVPWLELWRAGRDRDAAVGAIERAKTGGVGRFEGHCPTGLGIPKWWDVAISAIPGPDGTPERLLAVARDVTEKRRAQEAIRESEERFRNMADNAPVMVWVTDRDGVCTFLSKSWSEFTGQSFEDGFGRGWTAAIDPADRDRVIEIFDRCTREQRDFGFEFRLMRHDGAARWAMVAAVPRRAPDGRFLGFTGSIIDITERKRAEDALREADQRKDEFLATLAHELRNPLAPIRNGLQIMRLRRDGDESFARTHAMMERQLEQMVRLIDDLLDLSRISRGKVELHRDRVDLATILQSALETSGPAIDQFNHRLSVELPSRPIPIDADLTRLAQVFANLLNNAAKYTPPGGRITLTVDQDGPEVTIRLRDNGIGIQPEMKGRVFEMFTQLDRSLERSHGGLGIGLSISKQLIEMHGGTIEVESEGVGRGSEFIVRLPVAPSDGDGAAAVRRDRASGPKGTARRILVADDNDDSVWSLATMLRMMGHEVRTASDGLRAVKEASEFQPDVVFLDIGMPNLNGYDACQRIREQAWGHDALIVAVTGLAKDEDIQRSAAAGFDRHLVKPVGFDALRALLKADRQAEMRGMAAR